MLFGFRIKTKINCLIQTMWKLQIEMYLRNLDFGETVDFTTIFVSIVIKWNRENITWD